MEQHIISLLSSYVPRRTNVFKSRYDGKFLMIAPTHFFKLFALNSTSAEIYELCNGNTIGEIAEKIKKRYPAENGEKITKDIITVLRDLEQINIITLKRPL